MSQSTHALQRINIANVSLKTFYLVGAARSAAISMLIVALRAALWAITYS